MAKIWKNRIVAHDKEFANCPSIYKNSVKELLRQDVANGIITEEDYALFIGDDGN